MPKQTNDSNIRKARLQSHQPIEILKSRQESPSAQPSEPLTAQRETPAESSTAVISHTVEAEPHAISVAHNGDETAPDSGIIRPRLADPLSARQLLHQRLQKYRLSAIFHADVVGPGQDQRWRGSFWIKGTLLGTSKFERTKSAAKEGAALEAVKWLNMNHYY